MKIIFLDIDGVLNSEVFYLSEIRQAKKRLRKKVKDDPDWRAYHLDQIDGRSVECLNSIIEKTDAAVVLSSSWRLGNELDYMQSILTEKGFKGELIDKTPHLNCSRGFEIKQWLRTTAHEVEQYVILDDDSDMTEDQLLHHFIWCDRYCGLSPTTAYKATRILTGEANGQFMGVRTMPKELAESLTNEI